MSYVKILIHAVIRTYRSDPTLPMDDNRKHLYRYINGIIDNKADHLYRINSMSDRVKYRPCGTLMVVTNVCWIK
jgi:hypothetical protein